MCLPGQQGRKALVLCRLLVSIRCEKACVVKRLPAGALSLLKSTTHLWSCEVLPGVRIDMAQAGCLHSAAPICLRRARLPAAFTASPSSPRSQPSPAQCRHTSAASQPSSSRLSQSKRSQTALAAAASQVGLHPEMNLRRPTLSCTPAGSSLDLL